MERRKNVIMGPICSIEPKDDYNIIIELSSGHKIILDLSEKLHTIRFAELSNPDVFKRVMTDGYSIIWKKGKIMIGFGEVIDILQSARALYKVG